MNAFAQPTAVVVIQELADTSCRLSPNRVCLAPQRVDDVVLVTKMVCGVGECRHASVESAAERRLVHLPRAFTIHDFVRVESVHQLQEALDLGTLRDRFCLATIISCSIDTDFSSKCLAFVLDRLLLTLPPRRLSK